MALDVVVLLAVELIVEGRFALVILVFPKVERIGGLQLVTAGGIGEVGIVVAETSREGMGEVNTKSEAVVKTLGHNIHDGTGV